jgi:hypothetical protein
MIENCHELTDSAVVCAADEENDENLLPGLPTARAVYTFSTSTHGTISKLKKGSYALAF